MRWYATIAFAVVMALSGIGAAQAQSAVPEGHRHHDHDQLMASSAHLAMYMQLLADRYAPETSAAWKQVLSERGQLMKQLHELRKTRRAEGKDKHETMKRFMEKHGDSLKARRELSQEFTEAVQAGDESRMKAVLPKLLQAEQAINASLKQWVESEQGKAK